VSPSAAGYSASNSDMLSAQLSLFPDTCENRSVGCGLATARTGWIISGLPRERMRAFLRSCSIKLAKAGESRRRWQRPGMMEPNTPGSVSSGPRARGGDAAWRPPNGWPINGTAAIERCDPSPHRRLDGPFVRQKRPDTSRSGVALQPATWPQRAYGDSLSLPEGVPRHAFDRERSASLCQPRNPIPAERRANAPLFPTVARVLESIPKVRPRERKPAQLWITALEIAERLKTTLNYQCAPLYWPLWACRNPSAASIKPRCFFLAKVSAFPAPVKQAESGRLCCSADRMTRGSYPRAFSSFLRRPGRASAGNINERMLAASLLVSLFPRFRRFRHTTYPTINRFL